MPVPDELKGLRLTAKRILVTKPTTLAPEGVRQLANSTLFAPSQSEGSRKPYGLQATVLSTGGSLALDIREGDTVIVGEFAGVPLFHDGREAPWWIVGESDCMAIIPADPEAPAA